MSIRSEEIGPKRNMCEKENKLKSKNRYAMVFVRVTVFAIACSAGQMLI